MLLAWLILQPVALYAADDDSTLYYFNIESQSLTQSLNELSNQTDSLILFSYDLVEKRNASTVVGYFTVHQALEQMLVGTGLVGGRSRKGVLTISLMSSADAHSQFVEEKKMKTKKSLLALLITAIAGGANAQDAAQQTGQVNSLEEIIVTAQKRAQSSQDISVSVDAFTRDTLDNFGVKDTSDLSNLSPGVVIANQTGSGTPTISIRGIGVGGASFFANQPNSAAVNIDGVYQASAIFSNFQIFDIEQVEVLKGPQGTLYGRNSSAGAINFNSRKPSSEPSGYVKASYGSFNTSRVEAASGGAITEGLNYRVAGVYDYSDGFTDNIFGGVRRDTNGTDKFAVRALFQFQPSDNVDVLLNIHGGVDNSDVGQDQQQPAEAPGNPLGGVFAFEEPCLSAYVTVDIGCRSSSQSDFQNATALNGDNFLVNSNLVDQEIDLDVIGFNLNVELDYDNFSVTSITAFDNFERKLRRDEDGGPTVELELDFAEDFTTVSQELRVTSTTDSPFQWIVGAYASLLDASMDRHADFEDLGTLFGIPNGFGITFFSEINETALGLFTHTTYEFSDQWTLVAGARYTSETKAIEVLNANVPGGRENVFSLDNVRSFRTPPGFPEQEETFTNVSGKLGLEFRPSDGTLIYGHWSRGFKSGGFPGSIGSSPAQLIPYEPEIVDSLELGAKLSFADNAGVLNLAAFYSDYQDKQVTAALPGDGTTFGFTNAASATIWGLEGQLTYLFGFGGRVDAGVAYLNTEYDEFLAPFGDASGNSIEYSPEVTANLQYSQTFSITDAMELDFNANVNYVSETFFDARSAVAYSEDGYTKANVRAKFNMLDSGLGVALFVNNITDEEFRAGGNNSATGTFSFSYGQPRAYGIEVSKAW